MIFVMLILLSIILQVSSTNCYIIEREVDQGGESEIRNENIENFEVTEKTNRSSLLSKPSFQIMQNFTKAKGSNLKYNVFDKMLSEEMFSIKQHLYEKDLRTHAATTQKTAKNNVPTPTLEVKQKWKVIESISKLNMLENEYSTKEIEYIDKDDEAEDLNKSNIDNEHVNLNVISQLMINDQTVDASKIQTDNDETIRDEQTNSRKENNQSRDKVIGLRSLSEETPPQTINQHPYKLCTCMKTNPSTTCDHLCTGHNAQTQKCDDTHRECSRKNTRCSKHLSYTPYSTVTVPYSLYSPFYWPYQTYFVRISTEAPYKNTYYHPIVFSDLKVPTKRKHRKTTKRFKYEDLYYESDDGSESDSDDSYLENASKFTVKQKVSKIDPEKPKEFVINVNGDTEYNDTKTENRCVYNVNHNAFVNSHGDTVVKDCYCSGVATKAFFKSFLIVNALLLVIL